MSSVAQHAQLVPVTDVPIDQMAALLKDSAVLIGDDTGALNLAAAVGTHAIGLFGASPPLMHSRYIHVVEPPAQSRSLGMQGISVDAVLAEVVRWLPVVTPRA